MKSKAIRWVLSLLAAFALWMYVVSVVSPESEATFYNVEVDLPGAEEILRNRGLMITSGENASVTLRIAGNRSDLNSLTSSTIDVTADVSKIWEPGEHALSYDVTYPGNIPANALSIQNRNPDRVVIKVEERVTENIPVLIQWTGDTYPGYIVDENVEMSATSIRVTGPKDTVESIGYAKILIDRYQTQTIMDRLPYVLCDDAGNPVDTTHLSWDVDEVSVVVRIQRTKQVKLAVEVIDGGGATEETSTIILDPAYLQISGDENLLERIDDVLVVGTVDLGKLESDTELTFPIVLDEGITNESVIWEVKVKIMFPELATKTLVIKAGNFRYTGVPEDMELEFITQELEIKVRGPKALIAALRESDVTVSVDVSSLQLGMSKVKAIITFTPTYAQVGVVGSYTISVNLAYPEPEVQSDTAE